VDFNIDSTGVQEVFATTRHAPALTRHVHPAYSVIEEFVEGFVEEFLTSWKSGERIIRLLEPIRPLKKLTCRG
jgi:hypothetical protein